MTWPLSQDYNEAIQNLGVNFSDAELQSGEPRRNALGLPVPCSGNFADVYEIRNGTRAWAAKCFTREIAGLRERYVEIGDYLQKVRLPCMVAFKYLDRAIRASGQWYPVVKMDWVEGYALNSFVRQNLEKPQVLERLAQSWVSLARLLREARLAHGDLQHGNVLLVPGETFSIKLVDYDGMFVPALARKPSGELGHPAYQHPQRLRDGIYNAEADRFPLLVVYCAIRALMVGGRALWDRYDNGDNLLFREQDLRSPRDSTLFWDLVRLNDPSVRRLVDCLSRAVYKPLDQTPLLEELVADSLESASISADQPTGQVATPVTTTAEQLSWVTAPPPVRVRARQPATMPVRTAEALSARMMVKKVIKVIPGGEVETFDAPSAVMTPRSSSGVKPVKVFSKRTGLLIASVSALLGALVLCILIFLRSGRNSGTAPAAPGGKASRQEAKENVRDMTNRMPNGKIGKDKHKESVRVATNGSDHKSNGIAKEEEPEHDAPKQKLDNGLPEPDVDPSPDKAVGEIRRFEGHRLFVESLAFSPNGRRLVTAPYLSGSNIGGDAIRVWDFESGKQISEFSLHFGNIHKVAVSPSGKQVLSASNDGLRLWDIETGRELRSFRGHTDWVCGADFSPDGKQVISCGRYDHTARLWDISTGREVFRFDKHTDAVWGVAFSPKGRQALSASKDRTVRLWDTNTGREIYRFADHTEAVWRVGFSADGRYALSGGGDPTNGKDFTLRLWDIEKRDLVRRLEGHKGVVRDLCFSPNGKRALSTSSDGAILWDLTTGEKAAKLPGDQAVAFTRDGQTIAFSSERQNAVVLWRLSAEQAAVDSMPMVGSKVQYLSDMAEFDVKVYRQFGKNGNLGYGAAGSNRIKLNGKQSPHGLSLHSLTDDFSAVKYRLGKRAATFIASVALNDSAGRIPTALTFQVLGDGKVLWNSKPTDRSGLVEKCEVNMTGVNILELRVACPGDFTNAQAVWLEPRVTLK